MMTFAITVSGRVQGVFFRASTRDKAKSLGLIGFVKNQPDGSVYIEACGEVEKLQELVDWCHQGPSQAVVENVETSEISPGGYASFEIRR
jgi:acylphosphatase